MPVRSQKPAVISLFSGAMGLDLGLEKAGFRLAVAVESNAVAAATIRLNRPDVPLIDKPIEKVTTLEILEAAGLEPGEAAIVTGGPCCQAFSTAGKRASLGDPRGLLFREFARVVREAQPAFYALENVRGLLSAAVTHRPLIERGPGCDPLTEDEQLGSAFAQILLELKTLGYSVLLDILNAADYGTPQIRERLIFIGSRDHKLIHTPAPTYSRSGGEGLRKWASLRFALKGLVESEPEFNPMAPSRRKYLVHVPAGGNWRDLPENLQAEALGAAYTSWGGRAGFFRRLSWDKPSPALTTRPDSKATCLCHPTELRALTIREYMRIQQFPARWQFSGSTPQKYKQIGNAVPVGLGTVIGNTIMGAMNGAPKVPEDLVGLIRCENPKLKRSLESCPLTKLNPPRMRGIQDIESAREWLLGLSSNRLRLVTELIVCSADDSSDRARASVPAH